MGDHGLCCTVSDIQCICWDDCRCRCRGCKCGPLIRRPASIPAMRECQFHGTVPDDHFPCRRPYESGEEYTARMFGEIGDL